MGTAAMSDEKRKPARPKDPGGKRQYTTFRIYEEDGEVLSELADKLGLTIAETFHQRYAKDAREALIKLTEERLRKLKADKPG